MSNIDGQIVRISSGGPPVELPGGFALFLENAGEDAGKASTGRVERAVLDDAAMLFAAMYQAIGRGDPDDPLYGRYAGPDVQAGLREVIAVFAANDWTVTGTASVNRREVELIAPATALVSWCADLRSVLPTEIATGHVLESAPGEHSYLHYSGTFQLDESGVWVATSLTSQRAAPVCL